MYAIAKRFRFSAAHVLRSPHLSDEENQAVYGKCSGPSGHGHDYTIEVIVSRQSLIDDVVVMRSWLESVVEMQLAKKFRFSNLNEVSGKHFIPTGENLVVAIWQLLRPQLPEENGLTVRLVETPKNAFVYRGNGDKFISAPVT